MRIIAGKHRGRTLKEFKGRDIRPTSDRAKEALFNIIQFDVAGSSFLDLFSGTGGIGLEAISRGAEKVVFADNSKDSIKLLKENLAYLKEKAEIYEGDALSYVLTTKETFDLVFLDPPYALDARLIVKAVKDNGLLNNGGKIIYEHSGKSCGEIEGLRLIDTRIYGIAVFDFYE